MAGVCTFGDVKRVSSGHLGGSTPRTGIPFDAIELFGFVEEQRKNGITLEELKRRLRTRYEGSGRM